jgi:hypothetical protein
MDIWLAGELRKKIATHVQPVSIIVQDQNLMAHFHSHIQSLTPKPEKFKTIPPGETLLNQ